MTVDPSAGFMRSLRFSWKVWTLPELYPTLRCEANENFAGNPYVIRKIVGNRLWTVNRFLQTVLAGEG
jgi:hypothetical protein